MSAGTIAAVACGYVIFGCVVAFITAATEGHDDAVWTVIVMFTWPVWVVVLPLYGLGMLINWLARKAS